LALPLEASSRVDPTGPNHLERRLFRLVPHAQADRVGPERLKDRKCFLNKFLIKICIFLNIY
jgi:hypothetical protein